MSLPASSAWGASPWGRFMWGSGGRAGLGYPPDAPATTLVLRVLRPYETPVKKRQPVDYSNGGDPYIYNKGLTEYTFGLTLRFRKSEVPALKEFYDTCADGKARQILYVDTDGARHIVRIMNGELRLAEEGYNKHTCTLTLRKEG